MKEETKTYKRSWKRHTEYLNSLTLEDELEQYAKPYGDRDPKFKKARKFIDIYNGMADIYRNEESNEESKAIANALLYILDRLEN